MPRSPATRRAGKGVKGPARGPRRGAKEATSGGSPPSSARPFPDRPLTVGISGIGGHVGIAMAVAFAHYGHPVVGWEVVESRRKDVARGRAPFYDPGLEEELKAAVRAKKLSVAASHEAFVRSADVLFLCLPTPSRPEGTVDLSFLEEEAARIGRVLAHLVTWKLVVVKSTSPPGTTERIEQILARESGLRPGADFAVACNPEFLAEGSLVEDAIHPSRLVLGVADEQGEEALRDVYEGFPSERVVLPPASAELVKYASNALLAVKVSFANEIARVAEKVGADVYPVMEAVGLDPRLGPHFLKAGPGFGGSCFPKDLKGLVALSHELGSPLPVTEGALQVNESQGRHVVDLAEASTGGRLAGREVALLGLAFKAGTDDVRESRAYPILGELLKRGALVRLHDPRAEEAFREGLPPLLAGDVGTRILFSQSADEALTGADLAILQCDWAEYRELPATSWKRLKGKLVVDARRSVDPRTVRKAGARYVALGMGSPVRSETS